MDPTAMFFTERATEMRKLMHWRFGLAILAAGALGGCESQLRLSPDYGMAFRQDVAAQIADPDAHYAGVPQPGSSPARVSLAQRRYVSGRVIQPASTSTSSVLAGGGGGGDSGGGAPAGAAPGP